MSDILHEVIIGATSDRLFDALSIQENLGSWWTTQILAKPEVGASIQASFLNGQHHLEILNLEAPHQIEWVVRKSFFEDWVGTHIVWLLSPTKQGTKLLFGQYGFPSEKGAFAKVSYGWAVYLRSLKHYLETGHGNPHSF